MATIYLGLALEISNATTLLWIPTNLRTLDKMRECLYSYISRANPRKIVGTTTLLWIHGN